MKIGPADLGSIPALRPPHGRLPPNGRARRRVLLQFPNLAQASAASTQAARPVEPAVQQASATVTEERPVRQPLDQAPEPGTSAPAKPAPTTSHSIFSGLQPV